MWCNIKLKHDIFLKFALHQMPHSYLKVWYKDPGKLRKLRLRGFSSVYTAPQVWKPWDCNLWCQYWNYRFNILQLSYILCVTNTSQPQLQWHDTGKHVSWSNFDVCKWIQTLPHEFDNLCGWRISAHFVYFYTVFFDSIDFCMCRNNKERLAVHWTWANPGLSPRQRWCVEGTTI